MIGYLLVGRFTSCFVWVWGFVSLTEEESGWNSVDWFKWLRIGTIGLWTYYVSIFLDTWPSHYLFMLCRPCWLQRTPDIYLKHWWLYRLLLAAVFAVLLATMAVPSIGGPVAMGTWHHPCGHSVRADSNTHEPTRHGLTKLLRAVKTQIGVAKKYFIKERENMNKTYRQVSAQRRSLGV